MARSKQRIGGYRIIAPIGAGAHATVYRAVDEQNLREVAIKVLAENHSLMPGVRRRFAEEYALRGTVSSPTIARIYDVGETDTDQPYLVLELADRGDLRRRLNDMRMLGETVDRDELLSLARHLTESLGTLHRAEIVHRDLSPANILIRSDRMADGTRPQRVPGKILAADERYLLTDLGYAKDMVQSSGLTAGGGTRGYAAPEQLENFTMVDQRADVFAASALIEWAAHDGPHAEELEPFLDIGLADEPDDRFDDMDLWLATLIRILAPDHRRRGSGRKIALVAAILVLVGLATAGAYSARQNLSLDSALDRLGLGSSPVEVSETASPIARNDPSATLPGAGPADVEGPADVDAGDGEGDGDGDDRAVVLEASAPVDEPDGPVALAVEQPRAEVYPDARVGEDGWVRIAGTAGYPGGVRHVLATVKLADDNTLQWWPAHPTRVDDVGAYRRKERKFLVEVDAPGSRFVEFEFSIPLPPGQGVDSVVVLVSAVGTDGAVDSEGSRQVVNLTTAIP